MPIYRGKSEITNYNHTKIHIPNVESNYTINVMPIYTSQNSLRANIQLQTTEIVDNSFTVYSNGANVKFFWMVCYD